MGKPASMTIGIDDNFFQLGGHSLKATVMVSKIHKAFHVHVPLAEIFKTPTIRGLANYIKTAIKDKYVSIEPVEKKEYYSLVFSAEKIVYIVSDGSGRESDTISLLFRYWREKSIKIDLSIHSSS